MNRKEQKKENFQKMLRLSYLVESLSVATSTQQALIRKEIKQLREELNLTIRNTRKSKENEVRTTKIVVNKKVNIVLERVNKSRLSLTVDDYINYRMNGHNKQSIAELLNVNVKAIYYFCKKHSITDDAKLIADYLQREEIK